MLLYPNTTIKHHAIEHSDHCSIVLKIKRQDQFVRRPFRFIEAWASNPSSNTVVEEAWKDGWKDGMESHQLRMSLFNTSKALKRWNKTHFGYAQTKIKLLEEDLNSLQGQYGRGELWKKQVIEELGKQKARLESILRQKFRQLWLKD